MNCKAEYTDSSVVCARCGWEGRKRRAHNLTESGLDLRRNAYNKALQGTRGTRNTFTFVFIRLRSVLNKEINA